ncbi:MAG TPA: SPOR domain-containing protein [Candidatus Wallbacteria bacterium]|nr:SPOR domain-containing protein [Candidatus Wallbacteria bacterium]
MRFFAFIFVLFAFTALLNYQASEALANASNSPDAWSNGITDAVLENLPDADFPYTIECGPFKNRETARPVIYNLAGELGAPGYFHLLRSAEENPASNALKVRVGRYASEEEAREKLAAVKRQNYPNLSIVCAASGTDDIKELVMLDVLYEEFDEPSRYTGRLVISCTPEIPHSLKNFIAYSAENNEVRMPVHLTRISSNANAAIKRIRNQQHQLIKDINVEFDDQFGCHVLVFKMKRRIEIAKISQYAPVIVIDFEKMPN